MSELERKIANVLNLSSNNEKDIILLKERVITVREGLEGMRKNFLGRDAILDKFTEYEKDLTRLEQELDAFKKTVVLKKELATLKWFAMTAGAALIGFAVNSLI